HRVPGQPTELASFDPRQALANEVYLADAGAAQDQQLVDTAKIFQSHFRRVGQFHKRRSASRYKEKDQRIGTTGFDEFDYGLCSSQTLRIRKRVTRNNHL